MIRRGGVSGGAAAVSRWQLECEPRRRRRQEKCQHRWVCWWCNSLARLLSGSLLWLAISGQSVNAAGGWGAAPALRGSSEVAANGTAQNRPASGAEALGRVLQQARVVSLELAPTFDLCGSTWKRGEWVKAEGKGRGRAVCGWRYDFGGSSSSQRRSEPHEEGEYVGVCWDEYPGHENYRLCNIGGELTAAVAEAKLGCRPGSLLFMRCISGKVVRESLQVERSTLTRGEDKLVFYSKLVALGFCGLLLFMFGTTLFFIMNVQVRPGVELTDVDMINYGNFKHGAFEDLLDDIRDDPKTCFQSFCLCFWRAPYTWKRANISGFSRGFLEFTCVAVLCLPFFPLLGFCKRRQLRGRFEMDEDYRFEKFWDFAYWVCCVPCAIFQEALHVDHAANFAEHPQNKDDLYIPNPEAVKERAQQESGGAKKSVTDSVELVEAPVQLQLTSPRGSPRAGSPRPGSPRPTLGQFPDEEEMSESGGGFGARLRKDSHGGQRKSVAKVVSLRLSDDSPRPGRSPRAR